ncbi:hypothetical protein K9B35_00220 [Sphingomonas sp. R647]|uniref:hypothetical protein n=1 Tax=Sphingomonas sp. R647 TaxID=2875233 RepID=UPI001CD2F874|nr:hypothetical protein [Sphingomonas sp. R647]MCA1196379.1 hypothetical protein [Sphingomonas sp. R647]
MSERHIVTHRLESLSLDILHVEIEGREPITFVPFEDARVDLAEFLGEEHLLIMAARKIAIVHLPTREQTVLVAPADRFSAARPRTYSSARRSLFIPDHHSSESAEKVRIRQLHVNGSLDRHLELPVAGINDLSSLDDGRIVAFCGRKLRYYFSVIDPDTGQIEEHDLPEGFRDSIGGYGKVRLSHDGRFAARAHLGSVARFPSAAIGWFEQPGAHAAIAANHWPDRPTGETDPCYGTGYEIYDTLTGGLKCRVLGTLRSSDDVNKHLAQRARSASTWQNDRAVIDMLGDRYPYASWDGHRQVFSRTSLLDDEATRKAMSEIDPPFRRLLDFDFSWAPDARGLLVPAGVDLRRTIGLDGAVGPTEPVPVQERRLIPKRLVSKISSDLTQRSTITVDVPDDTLPGALAALNSMAERIEGGIEKLIFRDALTFVFRAGRRRIGETTFFKELRQFDPGPFVPPLRRIVASFGTQALAIRPTAHEQLLLGEKSRGEDGRTALAPAALLLAEIDPEAGAPLRPWFLCVDQGHDDFAASKVMTAFAQSSRFSNQSAVRFGLFFLLQQWQTLSFHPGRLRLIEAARQYPVADVARWVVEERAYIDRFRVSGPKAEIDLLLAVLARGSPWDDEIVQVLTSDVS